MPSQEDYLDSLLKNVEQDSEDTNDATENEVATDGTEDDDALLEKAALDLEAAFESDDQNLEELLGLDPTPKPALDIDKDEETDSGASGLNDVMLGEEAEPAFELDEVFREEAAPKNQSDPVMDADAPDLDTVASMSEDDIEKLLSATAEQDFVPSDEEDIPDDEDVLSMLDNAEDDDLQDIQDMLHKADNNEAVDADPLLGDIDNEKASGGQPGDETSGQNPPSEKEQRAQEKKLKKQQRAEAKAAAKAEKAAAKAAAKEAKASAKAAKSGAAATETSKEDDGSNTGSDTVKVKDVLFDTALLDSIVADADRAADEGQADVPAENSGAMEGKDENDSNDFDFESLFGDDTDAGSSDVDDSQFPDFEGLGADETGTAERKREKPGKSGKSEKSGSEKKSFFAKIIDLLTDEDEEDEENENLKLSDENREILDELDKEKANEKKKKKKKENKGKAKPKAKAKPKKPKKPKPEKPKKEKVPEPEPLIPERKLTLKRVMPIVLACASFGVFVIVLANASVSFTDKQTAQDAYYAGDYQTCFQNLYGKDLNETEQAMFGKSESILYIRLWLREYEMFAEEGSEVEALDSLIQTVDNYPQLYDYAVQWNAGAEVAAGYQSILNILLEKYGLTEEQAKAISAVPSNREYTRMIVEIVKGNSFGSQNDPAPNPQPEQEQAPLQDVLPEEEDLGGGEFIGN